MELQTILAAPSLIKTLSKENLKSLVEQYPYVPLFQFYNLKHNENYTEKDIQKVAFYMNRRSQLYDFLHQEKTSEKIIAQEPLPQQENTPILDNILLKEQEILQIKSPISEEKNEPLIEEKNNTDNVIELHSNNSIHNVNLPINEIQTNSVEEIDGEIKQKDIEPITEIPKTEENKNVSLADIILEEMRVRKAERESKEKEENLKPKDDNHSQKKDSVIEEEEFLKTNTNNLEFSTENIENSKVAENPQKIVFIDSTIEPKEKDSINNNTNSEILEKTEEKTNTAIDNEFQFQEAYKTPLLVYIENKNELKTDISEIKKEKVEQKTPDIKIDLEVAETQKTTPIQNIEPAIPPITILNNEPHTFVEWLKLLDGNLQIQAQSTPTEQKKEWMEIPLYEVQQTVENKKNIQQEEDNLKSNLTFNPNSKTEKNNSTFEEGEVDAINDIDEEVTKIAHESVSFKQEMMTETLAKIYLQQGKTEKALEIYNILRLKFPEKNAYFASLIQNLEKL